MQPEIDFSTLLYRGTCATIACSLSENWKLLESDEKQQPCNKTCVNMCAPTLVEALTFCCCGIFCPDF